MAILSTVRRAIFTGQDIRNTSYAYTSDIETGAEDGWITEKADDITVQYCVATLTATSLTIRIEGKTGSGRIAEIYTKKIISADTIDQLVPISEKVAKIRVGCKVITNASPNIFYGEVHLTERMR
jgi:hypothetical protein